MSGQPLLVVEGLRKDFVLPQPWMARLAGAPRRVVHAVDDVGFEIPRGRTLGLVGESGCGKSTLARCLVGLHAMDGGRVTFDGTAVTRASLARGELRRRVQMIFQDPYASLNPRWRVGRIVGEPLRVHRLVRDARELEDKVASLLVSVGMSPADARKYPHEFSGGQRQRISIARALSTQPEFLVCDEPTSALDVSVQAQILNIMADLQQARGLTYLFISHNLAVVRHVSHEVGVMYLGRLVEIAGRDEIFERPRHPYTRQLIDAIPDPAALGTRRAPIRGEVPNPMNPPPGCPFNPRCAHADERCRTERPRLRVHGASRVACHGVEEGRIDILPAGA